MTETATYVCSICNEPSLDICVRCTKDACPNHRCARCEACSDCCECEVPLTAPEPQVAAQPAIELSVAATAGFLLPPEASEEPDLNVPSPAALEQAAEQEHAPAGPGPSGRVPDEKDPGFA